MTQSDILGRSVYANRFLWILGFVLVVDEWGGVVGVWVWVWVRGEREGELIG